MAADEHSVLICSDQSIRLEPLSAADAQAIFADYMCAMFEGMHYPLPVFEKSSWEQAVTGKVSDTSWSGNDFRDIPGDKDHAYVQVVMRDVSEVPVASSVFIEWAERFYRPLLHAWPEDQR